MSSPAGAPAADGSGTADPAGDAAAPADRRAASGGAEVGVVDVRRVWQDVLKDVQRRRRATQILLESATVAAVEGRTLMLSMPTAGMAKRVVESGNAEPLRAALHQVLGVDWAIDCSSDQPSANTQRPDSRPSSTASSPTSSSARSSAPSSTAPQSRQAPPARDTARGAGSQQRGSRAQAAPAGDDWPIPEAPPDPEESGYEDDIPEDYGDPAAAVSPASVHDPEEAAMTLLASELGGKRWDPDAAR